jgi:hypothetical protein
MVTVGDILDEIGHRSFGVWITIAGVVTVAPIVGDIPGVPTIVAILILLLSDARGGRIDSRPNRWTPTPRQRSRTPKFAPTSAPRNCLPGRPLTGGIITYDQSATVAYYDIDAEQAKGYIDSRPVPRNGYDRRIQDRRPSGSRLTGRSTWQKTPIRVSQMTFPSLTPEGLGKK